MRFTKLHGCGNDYVYVDLAKEKVDNPEELAIKISDRHKGVGSDGLILIETLPKGSEAAFRMRMFNLDGSEGEMCGNGIRGLAKYVYDHGLTDKKHIPVMTGAGVLHIEVFTEKDRVETARVAMGVPTFTRADAGIEGEGLAEDTTLEINGRNLEFSFASMGNPHAITFVDDVASYPVRADGPVAETHPMFPGRINVHFVEIISPSEIRMRTWERGSGETQACGTGASAVVAVGVKKGIMENRTLVHLPGGDLQIEWPGEGETLYMTGPAVEVFSGEWPE